MAGEAKVGLLFGFGVQSDVQGSVQCVDENTIIYPLGRAIALHNTETRAMAFVNEGERSQLMALALAPSKKYLALCEGGEHAQVSVFHLASQRRHRTLTCPDLQLNEFVSVAFSADSRMLAAIGGGAECILVLWLWEKGKLLATQRLLLPANRVTFNPADTSTIGTSGVKFLKLWRNTDGQLKGFNLGLGKREHQNYTDHCWLPRDKLVACADSGDLLVFDQGELKQHIELKQQLAVGGPTKLLCLCAFARGFIAAGARGRLCVFESRDEKEGYQLTYTFSCTQATTVAVGAVGAAPGDRTSTPLDITSLCISPSEENLVCACSPAQVATFPLANIDILQPGESHFHFLGGGGFHHMAITGLDCCIRKPLLVTCSADRSLRIWNYATKVCEQVKLFSDDPLSASLHPSGHQVLIGFSDKLRLFNILMDDVRQLADFPVKTCRECRFAHGGQYFAAVSGPYIYIFNSYTCEQISSLKGHSGPIKCICWKADDLGMVSAGYDGAVYEWQWGVEGMDRVGASDHVLKYISFGAGLQDRVGESAPISLQGIAEVDASCTRVDVLSLTFMEVRNLALDGVTTVKVGRSFEGKGESHGRMQVASFCLGAVAEVRAFLFCLLMVTSY